MERKPPPPPLLPKSNEPEQGSFWQSDRTIRAICIVIALVFWLITKLSYTYQDVTLVQLNYDMPEERVFTFTPVHELEVTVNGTGWELLQLIFSRKKQVLTIPVAPNESRLITTSSWTSKVSKVLSQVRILNIQPETIRLKTELVAQKTVPIVLDHQVRLVPMHQLVDTFSIQPSSVEIKGPASVVRDIKSWETAVFIPSKPISSNIDVWLALSDRANTNVTLSVDKVHCTARVEELTEKKLSVPVSIRNAPDDLLLVLLPKTIEITAKVGLSDYDQLSASDFKAIADFSGVNLYEERSVKVALQFQPNYVSNVQFSPKKLDYIMRSKNL